jgi:hypothetical protein
MRFRTLAVAGAGVLALSSLIVTPAHAAEGDAMVSVLHGVPGLTVDVYVDGKRTLNDFKPGSLAGPLELPGGTYSVAITAADADDDSDPAIGPVDVTVDDGGNYTIVAHLDEGGDPTATAFENDTSTVDAALGRLTVRHVAAAPAVDVLAGGKAVIEGLTNPNEESLELDVGTVEASVAAAGTTDPVIGPAPVEVKESTTTIVYAWGSLDDDNLKLAVQEVKADGGMPNGVPSGQAGLAADASPITLAAGAAVLLMVALALVRLARPARARAQG